MGILNKAGVPAITVEPTTNVMRAVSLMQEEEVDTLLVEEGDELIGILTQGDVAFRVLLSQRDPETTLVRDVMTSPPITLPADATIVEAIRMMAQHHVSQLPIAKEGSVKGMVSLRSVFREQAVDLTQELDSLVAYHSADGIGG